MTIEKKNNMDKDPNILISQFIQLLNQLMECLDAESEALQVNNRNRAALKSREKALLLQNYEVISMDLKNNPGIMDAIHVDLKNNFIEKVLQFEKSLKVNSDVVLMAKKAVNKLIVRIMGRARDALKSPHQPYNNKGQIAASYQNHSMTPIRLSEEL